MNSTQVISVNYHEEGITADKKVVCQIIVEDHPTIALCYAYSILKEIMPKEIPWYIQSIYYYPNKEKDSESRLEIRAAYK